MQPKNPTNFFHFIKWVGAFESTLPSFKGEATAAYSFDVDQDFESEHTAFLHKAGRVASVRHHCRLEGIDYHTWRVKNKLPRLKQPMAILEQRRKWALENHYVLTPYGEWLSKNGETLASELKIHETLIKMMVDLEKDIRKYLNNIRKGIVFFDIDFVELVYKRDRIQAITKFYYDCIRQYEESADASVCTGRLIGNDNAVPYSCEWVLDYGLYQVLENFGVDPSQVLKDSWYISTDKYYREEGWHWWRKEPNSEFMQYGIDEAEFMCAGEEHILILAR